MFDVGFGEILLIAVVALLVLGPERLPKAARFAGLWVRRARAQWYSVKAELENELADEELKRSLKQAQADLMEARASLAQGGMALQRQIENAHAEVHDALRTGTTADADGSAETSQRVGGAPEPTTPTPPGRDTTSGMASDADAAGGHDERR
jgi:sec-independent protein translocase protein TatB